MLYDVLFLLYISCLSNMFVIYLLYIYIYIYIYILYILYAFQFYFLFLFSHYLILNLEFDMNNLKMNIYMFRNRGAFKA